MRILITIFFLSQLGLNAQTTVDNFRDFQYKFFSDSVYQKNHIKFPLKKVVYDSINDKIDTLSISKKNWRYDDFEFGKLSYMVQTYDNYEKKLRDTKQRVISFEGLETGLDLGLFFSFQKDAWYLVRIENLGD